MEPQGAIGVRFKRTAKAALVLASAYLDDYARASNAGTEWGVSHYRRAGPRSAVSAHTLLL
eukprot:3630178-Rhodomonas_salina.2